MISLVFDANGDSQTFGPDVYGITFLVRRSTTFTLNRGKLCTCDYTAAGMPVGPCQRHVFSRHFYWLVTESGESISCALGEESAAILAVESRLARGSVVIDLMEELKASLAARRD